MPVRLLLLVLAGAGQGVSLAWPWPGVLGIEGGQALAGLQVLSLSVLVAVVQRVRSRGAAFGYGAVFATAWLSSTFWWLFVSMHVYGGLPEGLAVAGVGLLSAALGLYYAAAAAVFWSWRAASVWARAAVWAALWTLAEWARATWFTGFPWGAVGYAHVEVLGPLAAVIGVYGVGALAAWLAGLLAAASRPSVVPMEGLLPRRYRVGMALLVLALSLPGLWWSGTGRVLRQWLPDDTQSVGTLPVRLLQGQVPQDQKFEDRAGVRLALEWYRAQLLEAIHDPSLKQGLVVLPETAIPLLPRSLPPGYLTTLRGAVLTGQTGVLLGMPTGSAESGYRNSALGWAPGQADFRYDKAHLVPFGEFVPPLFQWWVDLMHIPLGEFRRGPVGALPWSWAGQRIAPHICYEDLFGEELALSFAHAPTAPTVLVNLSNIAWFGDTVAIDQHRHIARMRAIELGRPVVRATNTGSTVLIDHRGRVLDELPRQARGSLSGVAEGREGLTPYTRWVVRWGLWPLVCGALLILLWYWPRRRG